MFYCCFCCPSCSCQSSQSASSQQLKPQQKSRSKTSSGSNNCASKNSFSSWSCMQRKSALAQHHSAPNSAMAALAAAGMGQCGFAGGLHPAVEAMDLAGLFAGGPLSPDAAGGSSSVGSGLGDPSSWSTVIPVHLLPMVSQVCGQLCMWRFLRRRQQHQFLGSRCGCCRAATA